MKDNPYSYLLVKGHMAFWIGLFTAIIYAATVRYMPGLSEDFRGLVVPMSNWMVLAASCALIGSQIACAEARKNGSPDPAGRHAIAAILFKSLVAFSVLIYAVTIFI